MDFVRVESGQGVWDRIWGLCEVQEKGSGMGMGMGMWGCRVRGSRLVRFTPLQIWAQPRTGLLM